MTRKRALVTCMVFTALLAALIALTRLLTAERNERDVLKLAAAQPFDPGTCLAILTSPNVQGGYDFDAADQSLRNTALADLDQVATSRNVPLIVGDSSGAGLGALAKGLLRKPVCTSSVTFGTPRFYGNFAFVNFEAVHWDGRMAFQQTRNGWRFLERTASRRGPIV